MENGKNKVQKAGGANPDAAGLGNPDVAAQVEITSNENAIGKDDPRYVPADGLRDTAYE
ncbi:hypothetical protein [Bacillus sp. V5-8f]|uniref:hypothetical protein n=1 Tax=Bacillus sp. V5-8f TaxID=2053044 RepID=UPI0015E09435|nr:hypothetical protein [Bacillus sp. V5-8f]